MPAISRIRFTNVVYENGGKRYNDETFHFDGHSGAIVLENGGGKTVFIQTALQAILPHCELADRKIKETLSFESSSTHVAIEWITHDAPRRYAVTAVTLFMENNGVSSYKYVYEYGPEDSGNIELMPFVIVNERGDKRPAGKGEMLDYYQKMAKSHMSAKLFDTIVDFHQYIEDNFKIIPAEWRKIGVINSAEGDVEKYFEGCRTTPQLLNRLLIPVVEEALEGKYKQDFVRTFEKQQEHFKKNKLLTEQILESQALHEKLKDYTGIYQLYDGTLKAYAEAKMETKTVYRYLDSRLQAKKNLLLATQNQLEDLDKRDYAFKHQKESYGIWMRAEEERHIREDYDRMNADYERVRGAYREAAAKSQNLEITRLKQELDLMAAQREGLENALKQLETDADFARLKAVLDENSGFLAYAMSEEMDSYERQEMELDKQKGRCVHELEGHKALQNQVEEELRTINKRQSELATQISIFEKDLKRQLPVILGEGDYEDLDAAYEGLKSELELLQATMLNSSETLDREKQEKDELEKQQQSDYAQRLKLAEMASKVAQQLAEFDLQAGRIDRMIAVHMPSFYGNEHLYSRQNSIEGVLTEKEISASRMRDRALKDERQTAYLSEQHEDQDVFVPDRQLAQIVGKLKPLVDFVELGSIYAKNMGMTDPVLAAGIVTTARDLQTVKARLEANREHLSQPVWLFTTQDLTARNPAGGDCIFPQLWTKNLVEGQFVQWKEMVLQRAKEAAQGRMEYENELMALKTVRQHVDAFFKHYPYEDFEALKGEAARLSHEISTLEEASRARQKRMDEISDNQENLSIIISLTKDAMVRVRDHMAIAQECQQKQKLSENLARDLIRLEETEEEKSRFCERIKLDIKTCEGVLEQLRWDARQLDELKSALKGSLLYKELVGFEGLKTDETKEVLLAKRKQVQDQLSGKSDTYENLNRQLENKNEEIQRRQKAYRLKEQQAEYAIEMLNTADDHETERLIRQVKQLKQELVGIELAMKAEHDRLIKIQAIREEMSNRCELRYGHVYRFEGDMLETEKRLHDEERHLRKEKEGLSKRHEALHRDVEIMSARLEELKKYDFRHEFLQDGVPEMTIRQELADEIEHNPKSISEIQRSKLETARSRTDEQLTVVNRQKDIYKKYVTTQVRDVRLKEVALEGIDNRKSYEDLLDYAERMATVIEQGIQFAEHARRTYDQELQIFLEHLYTYVVHVLNELDVIQSKTRINIDGNLKQIFEFTIPQFEEMAAKEELRRHMDRIIDQIDQKSKEEWDDASAKKFLAQWLSVKSLIECILKDQPVKIKCRKVTNDKKITSSPFSWESSNQWSGGEKWSKNMSLFLGILIYMAEKKQFLTSSQKRQRTVILDNPFGKASSKHVLDPVFFIAERLGFQIIALTAHAEGDFIRNYFPVVYSCRLRQSAEAGKQVMTKEKEIHYAYLREKDPQSLVRFQETEQVTIDSLLGL